MKKFGYPTSQKLKQKKDITLLFEKGKWRTHGNIRIVFLKSSPTSDAQNTLKAPKVGVSVSKRYFKKATDRNYIKRLLREAYRHHKEEFEEQFGTQTLAMLFWISSETPAPYTALENDFINLCKSKK